MKLSLSLFAVLIFLPSIAASQSLLDVFPESTFESAAGDRGQTKFNDQFSPSGSLWDERLDERNVFLNEMIHDQDSVNSFKLRMGKGGQVYSLRGAFGESVPPSWRAPGANVSPWNDEVWQFVAVCGKYNGMEGKLYEDLPDETRRKIKTLPFEKTFFVHNSGAYIPGDSKMKSLYCPLLASELDQEHRSFRMLNWGLVPQIKTIHRSPILFYTQVRDAGDGVIELTWVVHNFSNREDIVFNHLNAPWGGTRISSLPQHYISSPEGKLLTGDGFLSEHNTVDFRKTGGWNLSSVTDEDDSPALALVYGRDKNLEAELAKKAAGKPHAQFLHSLYREWRTGKPLYETHWKDWRTRPENSFRNYDVVEVIPKLKIDPGTTIWYRSYLVVGNKKRVMEQAAQLVGHVDYGLLTFAAETVPMKSVTQTMGRPSFEVFTKPVAGTMPLFRIRNKETNQQIITTDPYHFVKQEKLNLALPKEHPHYDYYKDAVGYSMDENNSDWLSLFGYGYAEKPEGGNWARLSTLMTSKAFPEPDSHHLDLWVRTRE